MELNNMASESASQTPGGLNNSAPICVVPSLSLPDMDVGSDAYNSLALQQYQFEQLIVSQLTLAQQQADSLAERTKAAVERSAASAAEISTLLKDEKSNVPEMNYAEQQVDALAISIKAAAGRAAAHAADISRLLNDGNCDVPKVKNVELKPKREEPELKPHSRTPSSPTSISLLRSRPIYPIKLRDGVREENSQRDLISRSHRNSTLYGHYDDQRNYTKSSHRRSHADRAVDRDSHDRYTSSINRRSPLARKRSTRHRHDDSRSPQRSRSRSRSPRPRHRKPSRVHDDSRSPQRSRSRSRSPRPRHRKPNRVQDTHRISQSPLNSNRIYSHRKSMKTTPRDDISRRTLSPRLSTRSVLMQESNVDKDAINEADVTTLNLDVNCREVEDKPSRKSLRSRSSYSSRSHSTSDNSGKLSTHVDIPGHPRVSGDSRTYPSPESVKFMNERKEANSPLVMVFDGAEEIEEGELILSPKP